ncbi:MAG: septation protein SepH [Nocardioidaceae bacterium]
MRSLKLVGLSADGRRVIFVDDAGAEFTAPADDRLRAALRGDRARLGQLEIEMDSVLRPRDIQARIRSGDTPDAVATLAQVPLERIMPFCVPVLAERQHIAELARRSHVRRKNTDGPARRLSEVVAERLRSRNVNPDSAEWDAWRRDDGRWTVQTSYHSGERLRSAVFVFDAMGRYSLADDDEAKWLTGERQSTRKGPQPRAGRPGERRLSAVGADDDLLNLDSDDEGTDDLTAVIRAIRDDDPEASAEVATGQEARVEPAPAEVEAGAETEQTDVEPADVERTEADAAEVAGSGDGDEAGPGDSAEQPGEESETEPTPTRRKRQRRPSVPSWDEIMFGKDDDA